MTAFPGTAGVAEQALAHIMAPGQLCRSSLRDALAFHGAQMTHVEADTASLDQLKAQVHATVQTLARRYDTEMTQDAAARGIAVARAFRPALPL